MKNFSHGYLDQYADMEAFIAATENTKHSFTTVHLGANVGLGKTSEMVGLHDAVRRMVGAFETRAHEVFGNAVPASGVAKPT